MEGRIKYRNRIQRNSAHCKRCNRRWNEAGGGRQRNFCMRHFYSKNCHGSSFIFPHNKSKLFSFRFYHRFWGGERLLVCMCSPPSASARGLSCHAYRPCQTKCGGIVVAAYEMLLTNLPLCIAMPFGIWQDGVIFGSDRDINQHNALRFSYIPIYEDKTCLLARTQKRIRAKHEYFLVLFLFFLGGETKTNISHMLSLFPSKRYDEQQHNTAIINSFFRWACQTRRASVPQPLPGKKEKRNTKRNPGCGGDYRWIRNCWTELCDSDINPIG